MSIDYSQIKIINSHSHTSSEPSVSKPNKKIDPTDREGLVKQLVVELKSFKEDEDGKKTKVRQYTKKQRLEIIRDFIEGQYLNEEKKLKV